MMNCRQATHLLSEAQDRTLTVSERIHVRLHCMMCSGCANYDKHMDALRLITRTFAKSTVADDDNKKTDQSTL